MSARREKLLVSVTLLIIVLAVFLSVAPAASAGRTSSPPWVASRFDDVVPLVPSAVWVYLSWYVVPLVILGTDRRQFRRAAAAVLLAFLTCAAGWTLLPASMDRPDLEAAGGLSSFALRTVYAIDPPSNLFPSFHAAFAAIVLRVPMGARAARGAILVWMLAICVSCVLTKQHYLLDVGGGVLVGLLAAGTVQRGTAILTQRRRLSTVGSDLRVIPAGVHASRRAEPPVSAQQSASVMRV
jgi:membrane-associated phospholipid phosphatase